MILNNMSLLLCMLSSQISGCSSGSKDAKPYINEFFFKLADEKWLPSVQKRANDMQFIWLKRIIPRLHLFRKDDLQNSSQYPATEENISYWMNAFGNTLEHIEQDKYERIYQSYPQYRVYLPGVGELPQDNITTQKPDTTERKCSVIPTTKCEDSQANTKTCKPIKIAILDAFFDTDHQNLQCSIIVKLAHNFVDGNSNTKPARGFLDDFEEASDPHRYFIYSHGTMCMGRIASSAEHGCNRGGDTNAHIIPLKFIDEDGFKREKNEMEALKYRTDEIDIYSGSYGTRDNIGFPATKLEHVEDALAEGVAQGRDCKGSIYLFPSGNGNGNERLDNCNTDFYANSVHTITIASITMSYNIADETEVCPCALVATFGSPDPLKHLFMNTTKPKDKCTFHFHGTSAATAYAAGMISHALRENTNFSKRDIEHLLIQTADKGFDNTFINWQTNGAGLKFTERIGFGAINVTALKIAATTWQHVPEKRICRIEERSLFTNNVNEKTFMQQYIIKSDACVNKTNRVRYLEHVQLLANISCSNITEVSLSLRSPMGTHVGLLTTIIVKEGANIAYENFQWTFMTVHFWGENPVGDWILQLDTGKGRPNDADIQVQELILHGTEDHPSVGGSQLDCADKVLPKSDNNTSTNTNKIVIAVTVPIVILLVAGVVIGISCYMYRRKNRERGCRSLDGSTDGNHEQGNRTEMQYDAGDDATTELHVTTNGSPQRSRGSSRDSAEMPLNAQPHLNSEGT